MKKLSLLFAIALLLFLQPKLQADIIEFDLLGVGGNGLLTSNELHSVTGSGSGGEVGGGITFDTDTQELTINVGWGTGQGFSDLTGTANAAHLHGPADINSTAGVLINFSSILTTSATNGGISGTVTLDGTQAGHLLAGNTYINVHTDDNGAGEIRGNLIAVPEPASWMIVCCTFAGMFYRRKR